MDFISEIRLADVYPGLAAKIRQMAVILEPEGIIFRVTQGLRTWNQQTILYAQGRTTPGPIVTNARPGHGWHEYGLATDDVPIVEGAPDWNETHPIWQRMIEVGDSLGLAHVNIGSRNGQHRDWPHFQLTGIFPVTPNDQVRAIFAKGGITEVWRQ